MSSVFRSLSFVALAALVSSVALRAAPNETETLPLSGLGEPGEKPVLWDFQITAGRRAGEWTKIRVPSNWEPEGFGTFYYGSQGRGKPDDDPIIPKEQGNYRTTFTAPAAWQGRALRIVFEGAMTDTTVTINGQSAGPVHQGGFYRFHYDITPLVKVGAVNTLEVTVAKESANKSVNHAERRGDYWTFGGIYRPVWIEARPAQFIERTAIDARADGSFYAQVHLGATLPADSAVHVTAQILDAKNELVGKVFTAPVDIHGRMAIVRGSVPQPKLWTAETPNLYRVRFNLVGPGTGPVDPAQSRVPSTLLHTTTERFGFRTFEVRARDGLYLNGAKVVLKGVNRHCFWPDSGRMITREQSYTDARLIKEANMNAVRMSHYPPDKHFLEACDELGLYVLDELAGWQGFYDTPTGARLIGQIVRRDVNHPSILFWDNGNEGGWNRENDGEFDRWDPQRRPVLHPWSIHGGVNTDHYEKYASTVKLSAGPDIFMPTEFLHGLYDGGIGAGFRDYWDVMGKSPTVGGGFFWVWADEGVLRADQGGRIDNMGNAAPDGMVGPHREKEGSFFAVKEIWSPVQVTLPEKLPADFNGTVEVENVYDFTDLARCSFSWELVRLPEAGGTLAQRSVTHSGTIVGPAVAPRGRGKIAIPLPKSWPEASVLLLTAKGPAGEQLWTWSSAIRWETTAVTVRNAAAATAREDGNVLVVSAPAARKELRFDRTTGLLADVRIEGATLPFGNGPRLAAFRRNERKFDDRAVAAAGASDKATTFSWRSERDDLVVEATYAGALSKVTWRIKPAGDVQLDYAFTYENEIDALGVRFDLPEASVKSKRWLGQGPYHVWQNRLGGGTFDVHETAYNDSIPGQTYVYPEFKGYFRDWRWLALETSAGRIVVQTGAGTGAEAGVPFFGLFKPQGGEKPVLDLPDVGVAFLHVIPAIGTKFEAPDPLGPQSVPRKLSGVQRGSLMFRFEGK